MATIEGYRLQNWRYSSRTEELINIYNERETWSEDYWKKWVLERDVKVRDSRTKKRVILNLK